VRIALLHPAFWPEVRRGGERYVRDLADELIRRGHQPHLITSHPGRPGRGFEDGLEITRNWRPPERWLRRRGFDDYLSHVPFSYATLKRGDYDLAHALYPTDALAAVRWSRRTGRPAVLSYLGVPNERPSRRDATVRSAPRASAVTAMSVHAAGLLEARVRRPVEVISPGVDLERFAPGPRAFVPTIFFAGDPGQRRKRAHLLVEAFAEVRRARPETRLVITRPRDPALASRLTRTPGVELDSSESDEALAQRYASAWVVCLPSFGEAFGLVLIEAMAAGTPVVGSEGGAFGEIIDRPEIGRLFAGDLPGPLASALLEALMLAERPETAAACRERAGDYSLERFGARNEDLYRRVLDSGGGRL
jgi:phosphatidylinositol alpha-mannosyltransferase